MKKLIKILIYILALPVFLFFIAVGIPIIFALFPIILGLYLLYETDWFEDVNEWVLASSMVCAEFAYIFCLLYFVFKVV